ncbi:50S ribosomal protein L33 [Mycoplasmopsis lipofaciens]|nr:50S ribosomal protein L33 [Mycoplasmopsis lipofaciens]
MQKRKVALCCEICQSLNYVTPKGLTNQDRIMIKKFCPRCRIHTLHKEEK